MKYLLILFLFASNETKFDTLAVKYESKAACVAEMPDYIRSFGDRYMASLCVPDDGSTVRHYRGDYKVRE